MTPNREPALVRRQVTVEIIPEGHKFVLPEGTMVEITQALGSSFTLYVEGRLVRLKGEDADAIGKGVPEHPGQNVSEDATDDEIRELVWETLKTCYDPEIPVDIYELGLIYKVDVSDDRDVAIEMTLTAPGCPVAGEMPGWVETAVEKVDGVRSAKAELVFDPPWDSSKMSDEAKLALNMF